ncbi:MAG: glycosyltransferase family 4 protein [Thermosphaera sp.]
MRLLYIAPSYHPHVGGVEYVVKSVAERLAERGHEVTVLCGEPNVDNPKEEWINNVRVVRWPVWAPGGAYHLPRLTNKLRDWLLNNVNTYDVIHFHSVHSVLTIYCLNLLKSLSVRKVLTPYYHGTGHTTLRRILWKLWRSRVRYVVRFVDVVHTVSKLEAQLVERDLKVKAVPIENGVDERILELSWSPSNYVMYSGRIEKYKNIHRLANIVRILNTSFGFDLELKIFGTGPYARHLARQVKNTGLKFSINPPQPFEKYIDTMSKALVFGLLSEKESYPQSVNEANAIGVPVVVAEPWGSNFHGRSRTLITQLHNADEAIAREVVEFLEECKKQPRAEVPSWNQVVNFYVKTLYVNSVR